MRQFTVFNFPLQQGVLGSIFGSTTANGPLASSSVLTTVPSLSSPVDRKSQFIHIQFCLMSRGINLEVRNGYGQQLIQGFPK